MRIAKMTIGAGVALAALAAACSDTAVTNPTPPTRVAPTGGASLNLTANVGGKVIACNSSPVAGTYTYSASATNTTNATFIGATFTLTAGQCKDVLVINSAPVTPDPGRSVTVTQTGVAPGAQLDHILKSSAFEGIVDQSLPGPGATVSLNFYHGAVLGFFNKAVVIGCTFTQGYWGAKPGVVWPAPFGRNNPFINAGGSGFGNSGLTWQQALVTPPSGGNSYLILSGQYIAAVLNKANGASVPAAVQTTINAAAAYFAGLANGVSYVKNSTLNGWADILDTYNNGLSTGGPPHCSEIDAID